MSIFILFEGVGFLFEDGFSFQFQFQIQFQTQIQIGRGDFKRC